MSTDKEYNADLAAVCNEEKKFILRALQYCQDDASSRKGWWYVVSAHFFFFDLLSDATKTKCSCMTYTYRIENDCLLSKMTKKMSIEQDRRET